jgi:hypothetical protein
MVGMLRRFRLGDHVVREYSDRLAIWRCDGKRLTWEELQSVKTQVIGDRVAVEVYPADADVVNLRHTRHLWFGPQVDALSFKHPEFNIKQRRPANGTGTGERIR